MTANTYSEIASLNEQLKEARTSLPSAKAESVMVLILGVGNSRCEFARTVEMTTWVEVVGISTVNIGVAVQSPNKYAGSMPVIAHRTGYIPNVDNTDSVLLEVVTVVDIILAQTVRDSCCSQNQ